LPYSDALSLRLRLPALTSHAIVTRRFILQKARRQADNALRLIVGTRFQVLFHSAPAVLFTFPSRYWFTIGCQVVFSLRRWSSQIPTGFLVSRGTRGPSRSPFRFRYGTFTLSGRLFQTVLLRKGFVTPCETPHDPACASTYGLGSSPFARHYLGNHCCFLFLRVLRCFSSPGVPSHCLWIQQWILCHYAEWVSPFGNPRIKACLRLPEAYRR
jgi:hypothetical protein